MNKSYSAILFAILALIIFLQIPSSYLINISNQKLENTQGLDQFLSWLFTHHKSYQSHSQFTYRFSVFKDNLHYINAHNQLYKKQLSTYQLGLNQFSDLTNDEFQKLYFSPPIEVNSQLNNDSCVGPQAKNQTKQEFDWTKIASSSVRDQGKCTASYAFASSGSVQIIKWISTGVVQSFSPQQLIDCSKEFGNNGCTSGLISNSLSYYMKNGATSQAKYPFVNQVKQCHYATSSKVWEVIKCTHVTSNNDKALEAAVIQQPVAVMIDASSKDFQSYKTGIFSDTKCSTTKLNQGLLIVGFGQTKSGTVIHKTTYWWKAKNSFGTAWGASGYIQIQRHINQTNAGTCGINTMAYFPIG